MSGVCYPELLDLLVKSILISHVAKEDRVKRYLQGLVLRTAGLLKGNCIQKNTAYVLGFIDQRREKIWCLDLFDCLCCFLD